MGSGQADTEQFPVSFVDLEGTSTGTRKSLAAAYDVSYQRFAQVNKFSVPRFVVHDVVETIEGKKLRAMVEIEEEYDTQFIIAVLKEKLDSSGIDELYQQQHTILQLSQEERLFGD